MLDFIIALNKTGVMFYSLILNNKYEASFYLDLALEVLREYYVDQKIVKNNRKEIRDFIIEFHESRNGVINLVVVSNIGLTIDLGDFFAAIE